MKNDERYSEPRDQGTKGPRDQGTKGPSDQGASSNSRAQAEPTLGKENTGPPSPKPIRNALSLWVHAHPDSRDIILTRRPCT